MQMQSNSENLQDLLAQHAATIDKGLRADRPGRPRQSGIAWSRDGLDLIFRGREFAWPWAVRADGGEEYLLIYPTATQQDMGGVRVSFRLGPPVKQVARPGDATKTKKASGSDVDRVLEALERLRPAYLVHQADSVFHIRLVAAKRPAPFPIEKYVIQVTSGDPEEGLNKVAKLARQIRKIPAVAYRTGDRIYLRIPRTAGLPEIIDLAGLVDIANGVGTL